MKNKYSKLRKMLLHSFLTKSGNTVYIETNEADELFDLLFNIADDIKQTEEYRTAGQPWLRTYDGKLK